jgi:tetratricopeptide (TPR) repeat protein
MVGIFSGHGMGKDKLMRWLQGVGLSAASLLILVLAFPYLASAYHVEAAGREMSNSGSVAYDPQVALTHLQKAIEWEPDNAQAYRLLGRVYRAQGDWLAAIQALTHYAELRPDNPLGHIELAEVYETIEAKMPAMLVTDLVALLPQAAVEAPDVPLGTPHAQPGGPAWHSYVAATVFSLPPNFGHRPTLFMHSPSRVTYTLLLPAQPAVLRFGMGMDPQSHDWPGDGVTFELFVGGEQVFSEHMDKTMARQGWHERMLDLARWAGQGVALTLVVTPGLAADASGDWAGWGEPQVVDARLPALEAQNPGLRLLDEWSRAGLTAGDFIDRGNEARKAEQYNEAVSWYKRAVRLEPDLGDAWYYVGLAYEGQQQWLQALDAYERVIVSSRLIRVHRSSPHLRTGIIYQRWLDSRQPESALAAFELALKLDDFASVVEAADCHYRRGQLLRDLEADPDEYMAEFQRAVELDAEHISARIMVGLTIYEQKRNASAAEAELLRAQELAPQNKWVYYHLGEIYRQEGRVTEAETMYRQALEIDPAFESALKRLQALSEGG